MWKSQKPPKEPQRLQEVPQVSGGEVSAPLLSPIATCVIQPILPRQDLPPCCKVFTKQPIFCHFCSAVPPLRRCVSCFCLYFCSSLLFLSVPAHHHLSPVWPPNTAFNQTTNIYFYNDFLCYNESLPLIFSFNSCNLSV